MHPTASLQPERRCSRCGKRYRPAAGASARPICTACMRLRSEGLKAWAGALAQVRLGQAENVTEALAQQIADYLRIDHADVFDVLEVLSLGALDALAAGVTRQPSIGVRTHNGRRITYASISLALSIAALTDKGTR